MRRTYKSKKDAGDGLDRRDLLQAVDKKSSVFDAFSIQNIKQAKREISRLGSPIQCNKAIRKISRKKYVKRLVKDVQLSSQESLSPLAYLTPNKSIKVNKAPDLFDQLLNSSSRHLESLQASKDDTSDQLLVKRETRAYVRKKPQKKKYNYSDSDDSEKENSNLENISKNTSNIVTHELLVEKDQQLSPRAIDESINKIVQNLSKLDRFETPNDISNKSVTNAVEWRYYNRLTVNSPLLPENSPLCSTPFTNKNRSKSIYKLLSPINFNTDESPKSLTVVEQKNESVVKFADSIVSTPKVSGKYISASPILQTTHKCTKSRVIDKIISVEKIDTTVNNESTTKLHNSLNEINSHKIDSSLTDLDDHNPSYDIIDSIDHENSSNNSNKVSGILDKDNYFNASIIHISEAPCFGFTVNTNRGSQSQDNIKNNIDSTNITECECLGDKTNESGVFSNEYFTNKVITSNYTSDESHGLFNSTANSSIDYTVHTKKSQEIEHNVSDKIDNIINESFDCIIINPDSNEYNESIESDNSDVKCDSEYDTCIDDQNTFSNDSNCKMEPKVLIHRLDNDVFNKYHNRLNYDSFSSEKDTESSSNSAINSNHSSDTINSTDLKLNFDQAHIENIEDDHDLATSCNVINDEYQIQTLLNNSLTSSSQSELDDGNLEEITHEINESSSTSEEIKSADENIESNSYEEDRCFVTVRKRNVCTKKKLIVENSFTSRSEECEETLLSDSEMSLLSNTVIELNNEIGHKYKSEDSQKNETMVYVDKNKSLTPEKKRRCSKKNSIMNLNSEDISHSAPPRISYADKRQSFRLLRKSKLSQREDMKIAINKDDCKTLTAEGKPGIVLLPGKRWERSLSIYRRLSVMTDNCDNTLLEETMHKGRKYRQSVKTTMELQEPIGLKHNESIDSRRSTFIFKPNRSSIKIVKDTYFSRSSINSTNTTISEDLIGFLSEDCDDTIVELSKLSIAECERDLPLLNVSKVHDTSDRGATARDYVLRRCNQTEPLLFDECYPDTVLKNCRKIGEGVYGEVYLWRARDGRARVMKIVPIAGTTKVNGEQQKDFHEIISEIVIAMELSALRAPVADIETHLDEGKDVDTLDLHSLQNATDIFNEVLAVRCVYGAYPSRLLDLWELYDETAGSENDNPAALPSQQQYIVLELANAGQDLESYVFNSAEQAYALFVQVAYGLAVGEEAYQFEHRDLHWGNVLIAPTDQKFATFVLAGRLHRVPRCGVAATIIDYSLSRVALPLASGAANAAALYNDLGADEGLFSAVGDYQFEVYRLMRDKLGNDWKSFEPYTNILWLHYTVDKMITALRYKRTNTKIHKQHINKLKGIKNRILDYKSAAQFVLTDNELIF